MPINIKAFPTAYGPDGAKYATGGRNGVLRVVTNNNDSGAGSFRAVVEDDVPAIVVFLVGGYIDLLSDIQIGSNKTILGGVASGDGICFRNRAVRFVSGKSNIILRYIRSRKGDSETSAIDSFTAIGVSSSIVDHCSFSWSIDEIASAYSNTDFMMQNCMIYEALNDSFHPQGLHGFGPIYGGTNVSFFRNLIAHFTVRAPSIPPSSSIVDIRNILVYNWDSRSTNDGQLSEVNIYNSLYIPGPATLARPSADKVTEAFLWGTGSGTDGTYGKFYLEGNELEGRDLTDQWNGVRLQNTANTLAYLEDLKNKDGLGNLVPFALPSDWYEDAEITNKTDLFNSIKNDVGCSINRDSADTRIINEIENRTYTYSGSKTGKFGIIDSVSDTSGYPTLSTTGQILGEESNDYIPQSIIDEFNLDMTKDYISAGDPSTAPWKYIFFEAGVPTNYPETAPIGWEDVVHYNIYEVIQMKQNNEYALLVGEVPEVTTYNLTIFSSNPTFGTVSRNVNNPVTAEATVQLTATPVGTGVFQGWYLGSVAFENFITNDNPYNRVVNSDATVVASFIDGTPQVGRKPWAKKRS